MNRLRFLKYGSALVTTGIATTVTNRIIFTDSDGDKQEDSPYEKRFKDFRDSFKWSKINGGGADDDDDDDQYIHNLPVKDHYQAPKYPIVLCHGLSGFDRLVLVPSINRLAEFITGKSNVNSVSNGYILEERGGISLDYWYGIQDALVAKGTTVFVARVPSFGSIEDRAAELNKFITAAVNSTRERSKEDVYNDDKEKSTASFKEKGEKLKVNLIAHSMGGLDCRFLIDELEKENYEVVSLTTITTPHRGSEVADYVVDLADRLPDEIKLPKCIYELTTSHLKQFNKVIKDDPNVLYFSYGASFKPKWYNAFYGTWLIINKAGGGPNDGMVSVKSAKWGTYLGTLTDLDHLDLINWTNSLKRAAKALTPGLDKSTTINTITLYLDIADNLAKRGL